MANHRVASVWRRGAVALGAASGLAFGSGLAAPAAHAYTIQQWSDTKGDAWGYAHPDILTVLGGIDSNEIVIGVNIDGSFFGIGDRISIFFDLDANAATGNAQGTDFIVTYEHYLDGWSAPAQAWNGSQFELVTVPGMTLIPGARTIALSIPQSAFSAPTTAVRFFVQSGKPAPAGGYVVIQYTDRAPNSGAYSVFTTVVGGAGGGGGITPRAKVSLSAPKRVAVKRGKTAIVRVRLAAKPQKNATWGRAYLRMGKKRVSARVAVKQGRVTLRVPRKHLRKAKAYRATIVYTGSKNTRKATRAIRIFVR